MKIVVITPTYNERDNVARLVHALQAEFARVPRHEWHHLVVDDASPDGTADAVRELQPGRPGLHLLMGPRQGLGAAYVRGMRHAMDELGADVVYEMDADFSHRPADLPRLLREIECGADFVIGSRYVEGGSIPAQWGWHRKANSLLGNVVARYVAGIPQVRDCTAGFRAIRVSTLRQISLGELRVQGYAFQVALLHAAVTAGARVKEIPVDFVDRTHGESKLGLRDIVEFVVNAWWIRFTSSRTFLKFAAVGATGVVVNLGVFTLLTSLGLNKYAASPIAIETSIVTNFLFNNYWTFRARRGNGRTRIRGLKFNLVSLLSLCVSYGTFVVLSVLFPAVPPQWHQLAGIVPATLINYLLNSYWTFPDLERRRASELLRSIPATPGDVQQND
ncbi:MAG TPA: glycosyltransferase family 2 protein [Steroidobacteraceae bacterium]|nr:glycosyltransferase family 2 protein [Steroidobacteraceae bacterium]